MQNAISPTRTDSDPDYAVFERDIAERVARIGKTPLFVTDVDPDALWLDYLAGIPEKYRQHYTCNCCRRFIQRYGGLVTILESGYPSPVLWDQTIAQQNPFFSESIGDMARRVNSARVIGAFINGDPVWGNPVTGNWTHLSGTPSWVFPHSPIIKAHEAAAQKLQDYIMLKRGMEEFPLEAAVQAVRVLEADAVDRSEKTLGVAQWLLNLHQTVGALKGRTRDNIIWLAVWNAPPGWCHIRSTMISTLLDDIVSGLPFEKIKSRWDAKMHPLRYQRPQAAPKEGNIVQANKIVEALKSEGALERRFARLEEVTAVWRPTVDPLNTPAKKKKGGAFDHLSAKSGSSIKEVELPVREIAWDVFRETVLPSATDIEVLIPPHGAFFGMVTAVNPDAPPILQWDGLEGLPRNPVSWYFWVGGSPASQWGLSPGWTRVDAICLKPSLWQSDKFSHHGDGIFLVISSARESRMRGNALFPEMMKSEYHGVRSVIEAYARSSEIAGMSEGNANGILIDGLPLRVKSSSDRFFATQRYKVRKYV